MLNICTAKNQKDILIYMPRNLENMRKANINKQLNCDAAYHIDECIAFRERIIKEKNPIIIANVNGFEIGLCDNDKFIELLNSEIKQAKLCLEGKPNKFIDFMFCT